MSPITHFHIESAPNGEEALKKITNKLNQSEVERGQKFVYKFVFMDINMPVMDGLTATKKIN